MTSGAFWGSRGPSTYAPTRRASAVATGLRGLAADTAVVLTVLVVVGLFAISPMTLEAVGVPYLSSGGGIFSKFHPCTFLAVAALGLRCIAARQPFKVAERLLGGDAGVVLLTVATVIAAAVAVLISNTPVTPLIDTFFLPILVFLLMRDLDPKIVGWLALFLMLFLCANAVMALIETVLNKRYITIPVPEGVSNDPTRADATFSWRAQFEPNWRASALLGHPLVNGLIVGSFILCLLAKGTDWLSPIVRLPLLALQSVSMFAFGARAALGLTAVFGAGLLATRAMRAVAQGARLRPQHIAVALLATGALLLVLGVLDANGFFEHTLERFKNDAGSADTRLTMFDLFGPLSWTDVLLGPNKDVIATLQRMYGLEFGIESSWVGLVLIYGLIVTAILCAGLAAFSRSLVRASGPGASLVLVFYFLLVSVAATLSGKTTTFAMIVILILVFLPKAARVRKRPIASTYEFGA